MIRSENMRNPVGNNKFLDIEDDPLYSMDIDIEVQRKQLFQDAAAQLTHLYQESLRVYQDGYNQGKEDAFEEVLKWFLTYQQINNNTGGQTGSFKHVSVNEFFNFISSRL